MLSLQRKINSMEFTEDKLQTIKLFGQQGKTIIELASELGMMCHQFEDWRKTDNRLDEALKIYDYNFKCFMLAKFYSSTGKNPHLAREMYLQIYEFLNDPNKGKLTIETQEELLKLRDSLIDIYYRHLRKPDNILIFEGGSRCFYKDTLIKTSNGNKKISDLQISDLVLSFNHETNEQEYKHVLNVFKNENNTKKCYKIKFKNGDEIKCTFDHEIFYRGRYVCAKDLVSLIWLN